eukprot:2290750-Pleurochrysis_carterae.AAC.1
MDRELRQVPIMIGSAQLRPDLETIEAHEERIIGEARDGQGENHAWLKQKPDACYVSLPGLKTTFFEGGAAVSVLHRVARDAVERGKWGSVTSSVFRAGVERGKRGIVGCMVGAWAASKKKVKLGSRREDQLTLQS